MAESLIVSENAIKLFIPYLLHNYYAPLVGYPLGMGMRIDIIKTED